MSVSPFHSFLYEATNRRHGSSKTAVMWCYILTSSPDNKANERSDRRLQTQQHPEHAGAQASERL